MACPFQQFLDVEEIRIRAAVYEIMIVDQKDFNGKTL
jgi:hypothetical protein